MKTFKLFLETINDLEGILSSIREDPTDSFSWNALADYFEDQGSEIDSFIFRFISNPNPNFYKELTNFIKYSKYKGKQNHLAEYVIKNMEERLEQFSLPMPIHLQDYISDIKYELNFLKTEEYNENLKEFINKNSKFYELWELNESLHDNSEFDFFGSLTKQRKFFSGRYTKNKEIIIKFDEIDEFHQIDEILEKIKISMKYWINIYEKSINNNY